jgi:four helix bundle protein
MFNFEKLDGWQKAIAFADLVYSQTQSFPNEERFGLTNRMRQAAVSISSNIAEGSSRMSQADFARFVEIAAGSVFEVTYQVFIAEKRTLLTKEQFATINKHAEELSRMLSGLRRSLFAS